MKSRLALIVFGTVLTLFCSNLVFGQLDERYELTNNQQYDSGQDILIIEDTIYTLSGGIIPQNDSTSFILFKSTLNGIPIDTMHYHIPGAQFVCSKLLNSGDSLFVLGSVIQDQQGWDPCLAIFDLQFNNLFYQKYDTTQHIIISDGLFTPNNGILMYGSTADTSDGSDWEDIYLLNLDTNMNKTWDKRIPQTLYVYSGSINNLNGQYLLSGYRSDPNIWEDNGEAYLHKIDSAGNILQTKLFTSQHGTLISHSMVKDDRIYVSAVRSDSTNLTHNTHFRKPILITLDTMFNVLNEAEFGDYGQVFYSWLPSGLVHSSERIYIFGHEHPHGFVACFDFTGNYLWGQSYFDTTYISDESISEMLIVNTNQIIGIGYRGEYSLGPSDRDTWIFKIDSLGCISPNCNNYISFTQNNFFALSIYPNPTEDILNLSIPLEKPGLIEIYDLLGKRVVYQKLTSPEINVQRLERGFYLLKVQIGSSIYIGKFRKS